MTISRKQSFPIEELKHREVRSHGRDWLELRILAQSPGRCEGRSLQKEKEHVNPKKKGGTWNVPPRAPRTRNIQYTVAETAAETEATKALKDYEK